MIAVEQDSTGDCFYKWILTGSSTYTMGIDNSDNDIFDGWTEKTGLYKNQNDYTYKTVDKDNAKSNRDAWLQYILLLVHCGGGNNIEAAQANVDKILGPKDTDNFSLSLLSVPF